MTQAQHDSEIGAEGRKVTAAGAFSWHGLPLATKGTVAGLASACFFAGYLLINRYIYAEYGVKALDYAFLFNALAGLFAAGSLFRLLTKKKIAGIRTDWQGLALLCILGMAGMLLVVAGQRYTSSIHASLLVTTSIVFTMYFSSMFLRERITSKQGVWVVCLFLGLYLAIVGLHSLHFQKGDAIILLGAVFFGAGNVLSRSLMRKHGSDVVPNVRILGVAIVSAIVYAAFFRSITIVSVVGAWAILSAMLFWLTMKAFSFAVHHLDANHAIVLVNAQIVPAAIAGVLLLGENYTVEKMLGSLLVLLSIYFIVWKGKN